MVFRCCSLVGSRFWLVAVALLLSTTGARADGLDGYWRSDGYGFVFEIAGDKVRSYQVTKISALPSSSAHRVNETPPGVEAVFELDEAPVKISVTHGPTADSRYFGEQG